MLDQSLTQLVDVIATVETAKRNYLTANGWRATSDTPGCQWLWQKELPDGRVALTDIDTAISLEEYLPRRAC